MSVQENILFRWLYRDSNRYRLLGLSLIALHFTVAAPVTDSLRAALILVHFGLFLLWQPFWHRSREISPRSAGILLLLALGLIIWQSWLPLAVWILLLLGLMAGEQATSRRDYLAQALAVGYLLVELLLGVNPQLFAVSLDRQLMLWIHWIASVPPLLLLLIPAHRLPDDVFRVDYLRSVAVTMLALMLAAGSVLWMYRAGITYPVALLQTLGATGVFILASNWIWRQQTHHSIFQVLLNRYLLNLGTPFERYLMLLSDQRLARLPPEEYLEKAVEELAEFDWIAGVAWRIAGSVEERVIGHRSGDATRVEGSAVTLTLYSHQKSGPTFALHVQLLARLTLEFFEARLHSEQLKRASHLQAVYETGSRMTHDIKNLLQSLQSLSAAVACATPDQSVEALALMKRQMPELSRRLQQALDRMKRPNVDADDQVNLDQWWRRLRQRHQEAGINFQTNAIGNPPIPLELFDTVADNLISNAVHKRKADPAVSVTVSLAQVAGRIDLMVCDSGDPVEEEVAANLFRQTVRSKRGLGIGLYQCSELASRYGFELSLVSNEAGRVCFALGGETLG